MMEVRIVARGLEELIADFGAMQRKQVPFALRMALQRTAEEARDAVRQRIMQRGFNFRSSNAVNYLANAIIVERPSMSDTAPGSRYKFTVMAASKAGRSKSRSLLPWLEEGGLRKSPRMIGPYGKAVAVPIRTGPMDVIPRKLYPSATGIGGTGFTIPQRSARGKHIGARGQLVGSVGVSGRMFGKYRTFLLPNSRGSLTSGTIFQRTGTGDRDIRPLFSVRPSVQVQGRRYFFATVQRIHRERFEINFRGAMRAALFSGEIGRNRGVRVGYRGGMVQPTRAW